jgi:hypothetical protein
VVVVAGSSLFLAGEAGVVPFLLRRRLARLVDGRWHPLSTLRAVARSGGGGCWVVCRVFAVSRGGWVVRGDVAGKWGYPAPNEPIHPPCEQWLAAVGRVLWDAVSGAPRSLSVFVNGR